MIVFVPAIYGGLKQFDSVVTPVYEELVRRGVEVKWGSWSDEADGYICSSPYDYAGKKHKLIYCPHGMGLGERPFTKGVKGILFPGSYSKDEYVRHHGIAGSDPRYPMVGWAKSDVWFSSEREKIAGKVRSKLKLPYDKTVLFSGCYDGGYGVVTRYMVNAINQLLDTWDNYEPVNVIFKGHVLSTIRFGVELVTKHGETFRVPRKPEYLPVWRRLKERMDSLPYCNFINPLKSGNIFHLILVSDVLISGEGASAITECMITGKPTIQLGKRWYTNLRARPGEAFVRTKNGFFDFSSATTPFRPPQIFMPGSVSSIEDLPRTVHHALENPNEFDTEVKSYLKKIIYKPDGHASERAARAILEIMELR